LKETGEIMNSRFRLSVAAVTLALTACVSTPTGPSVMALPGSGKSFDQFRLDEMDCRQYSSAQVGGATANDATTDSAVKSGVLGAVLGGVAGAAIGGDSRGAATGAGVGLLGGAAIGSDAARGSGGEVQRRYDNAFVQCMYAKGHKVPVNGQLTESPDRRSTTPPPPPPGTPPPPPR
jgi:hypothetical protein